MTFKQTETNMFVTDVYLVKCEESGDHLVRHIVKVQMSLLVQRTLQHVFPDTGTYQFSLSHLSWKNAAHVLVLSQLTHYRFFVQPGTHLLLDV